MDHNQDSTQFKHCQMIEDHGGIQVITTSKGLKMIGARTQPCFIPTSAGKLEDRDPAMIA